MTRLKDLLLVEQDGQIPIHTVEVTSVPIIVMYYVLLVLQVF